MSCNISTNSLIAATHGRVKIRVLLSIKRLQGYIFKLSLRQSPLPFQSAVFEQLIHGALSVYHFRSCRIIF